MRNAECGTRNEASSAAPLASTVPNSQFAIPNSQSPSAAFFDVDGTLVGTHIVHHYLYIRRRMLPPYLRRLWTAAFFLKAPYYLVLDKISRTTLNVVFYRNYAGLRSDAVRACAQDNFEHVIRPHLFAEACDCIAEHRRAGRRIVLVTGSIDFIMAPLARYLGADDVLAPRLIERNGRFTGRLDGPAVGSQEKVRRIQTYAERHGLDLAACYAYGDSIADLPMLQKVGHPYVVNADKPLGVAARDRGWPTLQWSNVAQNSDALR